MRLRVAGAQADADLTLRMGLTLKLGLGLRMCLRLQLGLSCAACRFLLFAAAQGEKLLVFQSDSMLCSNSRYFVDDFLQYDWVGAVWSHYPPFTGAGWLPMTGGNGGLSIRSKSKLLECLSKGPKWDGTPEDVWYSRHLPSVGALVAGWGVGDKFSVEGRWVIGSAGVHQPWVKGPAIQHNSQGFIAQLEDYCPEYRMVGRYGYDFARGPTHNVVQPHKGPNPPKCPLPNA